jgi:hypothetical protein
MEIYEFLTPLMYRFGPLHSQRNQIDFEIMKSVYQNGSTDLDATDAGLITFWDSGPEVEKINVFNCM